MFDYDVGAWHLGKQRCCAHTLTLADTKKSIKKGLKSINSLNKVNSGVAVAD